MKIIMAGDKQHAHQLIDQLDSGQLAAVVRLLEAITDPVARSIAHAPAEDEPITAEEVAAVKTSKSWLETHSPVPHEEVLTELGLTLEDFERMARTPLKPRDTDR